MRRSLGAGAVLLVVLALAGCRHWQASDTVLDQPIPERRPVQVFAGGSGEVVHGVVAGADSVSFVPRHRPPACDSCRVAVTRSSVDSVRVRTFSFVRTGVLIGGILAVMFIPEWPERVD